MRKGMKNKLRTHVTHRSMIASFIRNGCDIGSPISNPFRIENSGTFVSIDVAMQLPLIKTI
jgi:hypothetical protein